MGVNDGQIGSAFQVFRDIPGGLSGPNYGSNLPLSSARDLAEIVFLPDGFTAQQQERFRRKVRAFVNWVPTLPWFDVLGQGLGFNIVSVESDEAGIDDYRDGANVERATYFDTGMGHWFHTDPNWLNYDKGLVWNVATQYVPNCRTAVLLVNSKEGRANASGGTAVVDVGDADDPEDDIDPNDFEPEHWMHVIMHELGHSIFGLADEYGHFLGCGEDTDRDHPLPGLEPSQPNLTRETDLDNLKWRHHVPPGVDVPTKPNPDCRECVTQLANPFDDDEAFASDTIGLFEGAGTFHCDFYRPAHQCRMNNTRPDFCYVCMEAIHQELAPFMADEAIVVAEPKAIPVINACVGKDDAHVRRFRVANLGNQPADVRLAPSHAAVHVTPAGVLHLAPGAFIECTATIPVQSATIAETAFEIAVNDENDGDELATVTGSIEVCTPHVSRLLHGAGQRTGAGRWALDLGTIVEGHTVMHRLRLVNTPGCCPAAFLATASVVSGPLFIPPDQANPIELTPPLRNGNGDDLVSDLWFGVTAAPGTIGPLTGEIRIDYATLTGPAGNDRIQVEIEVVNPPPFDVTLAVDRSYSMDQQTVPTGPRRIEVLFEAVDLFLSFLRDNDSVGLVRFNQSAVDPADVLVPLTQAGGTADGRQLVRDVLNEDPGNLDPHGGTALGAGGNLAMSVLDAGTTARRCFVLLSDGEGVSPPPVNVPVLAAVNAGRGAYLIALEMDELSDELRSVSRMDPRVDSSGNEVAPAAEILLTGTLAGEREFMLQKFYTQIVADEAGEAFVLDPVHELDPGGAHVIGVSFGEVDYAATITVVPHPIGVFPKYLDMTLESPAGTRFELAEVSNSPVGGVSGRTSDHPGSWATFDVALPALPSESHVGTWRLTVQNNASVTMRYAVLVKARSDFLLTGRVQQADHGPGLPLYVELEPTLFGRPIALDEPVRVRIDRPDGATEIVVLDRQDEGTYRGAYYDTTEIGIYQIAAEVTATTPEGVKLLRSRYLTGFVAEPTAKKGKYPPQRRRRQVKSWTPMPISDWLRMERR